MKRKKVVKKTRTIVEAEAIKLAINKLNKRLGIKGRATIRRTRDMNFEVLN